MLELGRPLHVYDLDKLRGGIDVRFGRKGESVKLLNEQTVEVDEARAVHHRRLGPHRARRHHGRGQHQGRYCDAARVSRVGVLLSRR